jgi:hypothetical protein
MGEIVVRREKSSWQDRRRNYKVFVDGRAVATVSNGSQVCIAVAEGDHVVRMGIDWCRSNNVKVKVLPGRASVLECGPNAEPLTVLAYATFLYNSYLWLREGDGRGVA